MDKLDSEFVMDMLFISVSSDDHEDAMTDILHCISDEDVEEFELDDIMFASMFAGMYHIPTSLEQEALIDVQKELAWRYLNG